MIPIMTYKNGKWQRDWKKEKQRRIQLKEQEQAEKQALFDKILAEDNIRDTCVRYGFSFKGEWDESRTCRDCYYNWIPEVMDGTCILIDAYRIKTERNNANESEVKQDGTNN